MIAKFDGIPGHNLVALLTFIHGDDNRVTIPRQEGQLMVVRIKAVNPDNQGGGTWYGLTLDILEWLPKGDRPGQNRVDSKYLLKVYEILGQDRLTECVSTDKPRVGTEMHSLISAGTKVNTTHPNTELRKNRTGEGWEKRKWGVRGTIAMVRHQDLHGLFYSVIHEDGTCGWYDPSEFEVVK